MLVCGHAGLQMLHLYSASDGVRVNLLLAVAAIEDCGNVAILLA